MTFKLLTCALILFASTASAQSRNCADHAMVVERLASGYGETRQSIGLGADNTVVEVFASLDTGTLVLPRFSSGLFRAMFAMKEIRNGKEIHRRVSA
ncbi:hypothetical protein [Octadecabacter arcticus]|uniref:hypothetical protein n=1 Tax=Octadecabacter arcticus TaxID=53946 RepID=UPI0001809061|nr:hypothetical protein [Octadecabacter arcticus]